MKNKIYQSRLPAPRKSPKPSYGLDLQSLRGFRLFAVVYETPKGNAEIYELFATPREARRACKIVKSWFPDAQVEVLPLEFPRYYFRCYYGLPPL